MVPYHDDILDEIVASLDPEDIPYCFIKRAFITDYDGRRYELSGPELERFLEAPYSAAEVRVVLNIKALRDHMKAQIEYVFKD